MGKKTSEGTVNIFENGKELQVNKVVFPKSPCFPGWLMDSYSHAVCLSTVICMGRILPQKILFYVAYAISCFLPCLTARELEQFG